MGLIIIHTQESGIPADAQVLLPLSGSDLPLSKGDFFTILLIVTFSRLWLFHDCAHCKFLHIEIIVTFVIIVLIVIYWDSSPQTSQWRLLWQLHPAPISFFSGFHIFNSYLQYIFIIFSTYLKNIFNLISQRLDNFPPASSSRAQASLIFSNRVSSSHSSSPPPSSNHCNGSNKKKDHLDNFDQDKLRWLMIMNVIPPSSNHYHYGGGLL